MERRTKRREARERVADQDDQAFLLRAEQPGTAEELAFAFDEAGIAYFRAYETADAIVEGEPASLTDVHVLYWHVGVDGPDAVRAHDIYREMIKARAMEAPPSWDVALARTPFEKVVGWVVVFTIAVGMIAVVVKILSAAFG